MCYFNRSYWPDTGATGQLLTELAEDLVAKHGIEVTVVTGYPVTAREPLASRETRNGVRIVRARGTTFSPRRFAGRAMNYLTYFFSALWAALRLPRQDVTIALTDPPIIGLAALAARPRHGVIFFCQDIFPEVAGLLEDFHSPLINALLERLNRFMVRRAVRIVALGDTMASRLVHGKGADPGKITVIHNWADTSAIVPSEKQQRVRRRARPRVDVRGPACGQHRAVAESRRGASTPRRLLKPRRDIVILFIGDGNRRAALQAAAESRGLDNVRFLPFQPRDQLRWTYASSDVCLVSLKPGLAGYIVPSKLYPILAAGRPYIAAVEADVGGCRADRSGIAAACSSNRAMRRSSPTPSSVSPINHASAAAMGARARVASELFARDRQVAAHAQVIEEVAAR